MTQLPHQIKCKYHPQSEMLFIEEPHKSPHDFRGVCKSCGNKFVSWVSWEQLNGIVANTPEVEVRPRPTNTFNNIFE
jgi:hypothetical protein